MEEQYTFSNHGKQNDNQNNNNSEIKKMGYSKQNQGKKYINFKNLKNASPSMSFTHEEPLEDLGMLEYDAAVDYLNRCTAERYLLPLEQMNFMLKKFQSARFGTQNEAERLYSIICSKLHNPLASPDQVNKTHREIMEVYIRRFDDEDKFKNRVELLKKLRSTFEKYKGTLTLLSLMDYFNSIDDCDAALSLYNEYPHFREDRIYAAYLDTLSKKNGLPAALEEYKSLLLLDIKLRMTHIKIIKLHKYTLKTAVQLFNIALSRDMELIDDEHIYRALLKSYIKNNKIKDGYDFFLSIKNPIAPTYSHMINAFFKCKRYEQSIELYKKAIKSGLFQKNIPQLSNDDKQLRLSIDFHNFFIMGGGATTYGVLNNGLKFCTLTYLFEKLSAYDPNEVILVEIICGQGKHFKTKNQTKFLLEKHFSYYLVDDVPGNPGAIEFIYQNFGKFEEPGDLYNEFKNEGKEKGRKKISSGAMITKPITPSLSKVDWNEFEKLLGSINELNEQLLVNKENNVPISENLSTIPDVWEEREDQNTGIGYAQILAGPIGANMSQSDLKNTSKTSQVSENKADSSDRVFNLSDSSDTHANKDEDESEKNGATFRPR